MNNKICHIVGAAPVTSLPLCIGENDYIIAADGGRITLEKFGISANLIVGDFDSSEQPDSCQSVVKLNPIKDITDTMKAVEIGVDMGYTHFKIYGGVGGRTEHTQANIQMMSKMSKNGLKCELIGDNEVITVIHNSKICFDKSSIGFISVFSLVDESVGVYESGLKYELSNHTLTADFPLGVSNEFIGESAEISVKNGTLLIIYSTNATVKE